MGDLDKGAARALALAVLRGDKTGREAELAAVELAAFVLHETSGDIRMPETPRVPTILGVAPAQTYRPKKNEQTEVRIEEMPISEREPYQPVGPTPSYSPTEASLTPPAGHVEPAPSSSVVTSAKTPRPHMRPKAPSFPVRGTRLARPEEIPVLVPDSSRSLRPSAPPGSWAPPGSTCCKDCTGAHHHCGSPKCSSYIVGDALYCSRRCEYEAKGMPLTASMVDKGELE